MPVLFQPLWPSTFVFQDRSLSQTVDSRFLGHLVSYMDVSFNPFKQVSLNLSYRPLWPKTMHFDPRPPILTKDRPLSTLPHKDSLSSKALKHQLKTYLSSQGTGIVMDNPDFIIIQELCQIIMVFAKHFLNMPKSLSVSHNQWLIDSLTKRLWVIILESSK